MQSEHVLWYRPLVYWLLSYDVVDDYIARREPYRPAHLEVVHRAHAHGFLIMGGAYRDPADGAAILFRSDEIGPVEQWAADDPYVKAGLVISWNIHNWNIGIGAP